MGFNNSVFLAEREHADRNFALAYYLKVAQAWGAVGGVSNKRH